ncbi:MAG: cadmium-translocating P-type ATPase [Bacillales bacterium]|jgi:Cd2+/Zn2+-exporting ATPase|nr:cadmium-translocating P-type ATPase [Bacillales bacterium]
MKYNYNISGLDCAVCAQKLEDKIKSNKLLKNVSINFVALTISFELEKEEDLPNALTFIKKEFKKSDDPVCFVSEESNKTEHEHQHQHNKEGNWSLIRILISAFLFIPFWAYELISGDEGLWLVICYFVIFVFIGYDIFIRAIKNILKGDIFDENLLMIIAAIGAFAIGETEEAVAVLLFYQVGEYFQEKAVAKSRKDIKELLNMKPDLVNLEVGEEIKIVKPEEVMAGDIILIKPGERIPLDGLIISGSSSLDKSSITGESILYDVKEGDEILSGPININGLLKVKVSSIYAESNVAKIMKLVEDVKDKKSKSENFITKFAKIYTPSVVGVAILLFLISFFVFHLDVKECLERALTFLVISCPCALVISIPLSFFGGIGNAATKGILIKGSESLEKLSNLEKVVFDKTGTITKGMFSVDFVQTTLEKEEFFKILATMESNSNHPIAKSITNYLKDVHVDRHILKDYQDIAGYGSKGYINDLEVLVGSNALLEKENISYPKMEYLGNLTFVAVNKTYVGCIGVKDQIKETSQNAIRLLKKYNVKATIMLTGDTSKIAEKVREEVGIDIVYSSLLPQDKVEKLKEILRTKANKQSIAFVGDGTNDAPALMLADVGIAMGGVGSDAAMEASDIVIMDDNLENVSKSIGIAKFTKLIATENIVFAISIKLIVLALSAFGFASMLMGVVADVGVAILAILNAIRVLKYKAVK